MLNLLYYCGLNDYKMKPDLQRIAASAIIPLFLLFVMYALEVLETGMDWDFTRLGVYPREQRGVFGIFAHPLVHGSWRHLWANSLPFLFLSWCLFYFYRGIAPVILFLVWVGCGVLTWAIGKPGWHVGASGIIYGLAFFLFFSGLLRKYVPLVAISLLVTFLYGGLVWNMMPQFARPTTWRGTSAGRWRARCVPLPSKTRGRSDATPGVVMMMKMMKKRVRRKKMMRERGIRLPPLIPTP